MKRVVLQKEVSVSGRLSRHWCLMGYNSSQGRGFGPSPLFLK